MSRPARALALVVALASAAVLTVPADAVRLPVTARSATSVSVPSAVVPAPVARLRVAPMLVTSGLVDPVLVRAAPDGTSRLFVVEQAGRVRTVVGRRVTGTFLDLTGIVASGGERGLLGLAFAPDYATSHLLWVTYTRADGALVLARLATRTATAGSVTPTSRRTVLVVPHPGFGNHNGGDIAFGPDGYLYLGTGDGGSGGDPAANGQNLHYLLGKMLRIDVRCSGHLYCVPPTNPYVASSTARHEIWMSGLRNPWRWSFDTNGTQWIGDVGQDAYEEVDVIPAGTGARRNLGWSCREGKHVFNASRCKPGVVYTTPVLELCHPDSVAGCPAARAAEALIGGYVYRGAAYPAAVGTYVLGDYATGRVWPFRAGVLGAPTALPGISGFGLQDDGELYAVTLSGQLYRLGFRVV